MLPDLLVPFSGDDGDTPPLYCVHSASGSCYTYLPLAGALGHQPVAGIEAPGYDGDGLPPTDLGELADLYVRLAEADRADRPVCLLGWSMGGMVAYAMANRLHAAGCRVPLVVLIDTLMHHAEPIPPLGTMLARYAMILIGEAGGGRSELQAVEAMRDRLADAPVDAALDLLLRDGLIPDDLDPETLSRRFEVFRRNVESLHTYRPEPGYPGPVLVIDAQDSPRGAKLWSDYAADARIVTVSGDHFSLWSGPGLDAMSSVVREALREALSALPEGVRP